jgi:multiple sugar transport system ATP-binding protein
MTVAENMGFSLKLRGERREVITRKVRDAAAILGLVPYLDRLPRQLSGGQRQRVAMGRSIVRAPRVFLFDEPLSNLDAQLRVQMRAEIKDLHQRLRTTTIYVTHDQVEAMTLADVIVVLRDGTVEQIGAPLDLYDRPANLFVAGFIGSPSMNLLEAEIDRANGTAACRLADGTRLPAPVSSDLPAGLPVSLGFRPEHLTVSAADGLAAEVIVVEQTGSETHVVMRLGGHRILGVFRERLSVARGDVLRLAIDPARVHVFDRETQKRM